MGFQREVGQYSTVPTLPLFSKTVPSMMQSPDHTGMLTPPLHTLASVPFQWEEEPGKPRPCTSLIALPNPKKTETKCLELPPRLFMESTTKITKTPSPTAVLDGPYVSRSKLSSSSFRSLMEGKWSFDSTSSRSPEKGQLRTVVLCKKGHKRRGLFDSWGKKNLKLKSRKKEIIGDDNAGTKAKIGKLTRNGSFSSFTQARSKRLWIMANFLFNPDDDPTSHYFLHPSDKAGALIVSEVFNGDNYTSWSHSISMAPSVKNKSAFIDGSLPAPSPPSGVVYNCWVRANNLVADLVAESVLSIS